MTTARHTGVDALDDLLSGGVPAGSVVVLLADPGSPAERLLYAASAANRTRYLTALRPPAEVRDGLAAHGAESTTVAAVEGPDLLADPAGHLAALGEETLLVVDPVTEAEQGGRDAYRDFLEALKRRLRETGSVGLLYCPRTTPPTLRRDLTLGLADHVWSLAVERTRATAEPRLWVRRARGQALPTDGLGLRFGADGVEGYRLDG
ncbi:MAG: RAD55 family ATPase [Haloferacaceae archaeon]